MIWQRGSRRDGRGGEVDGAQRAQIRDLCHGAWVTFARRCSRRSVAGVGLVVGMTACARGVPPQPPSDPVDSVSMATLGAEAPAHVVARLIGPLDLLDITVLDAPEFTRSVRVSENGEISLPLLGILPAAGRTPHELEAYLAAELRSTYMVDPQVAVRVTEAASDPIYVVGEVQQPGAFTSASSARLTVLQAVALARGLKPAASKRGVYVIRSSPDGTTSHIPVPLSDVINGQSPDLLLEPSDIVYVPTNTERSIALGAVNTLVRLVTFRAVF